MRFKPDRCAHCGGPPRTFHSQFGLTLDGKLATWESFFFCSDDCLEQELNRYMPAEVALGKTIGDDREYKALLNDYRDARRRIFPDGYLYSNQEKTDMQEFDTAEQRVITQYEDNWANKRANAITIAVRAISETWAAHHKQEWRQQQEKEAAEAAEHQRFADMILPRPIPDEPYRFEHTHVLGPSGSGKTTLIQHIVLDDLAKPNLPAMVIIDTKGLLVERISTLDVFNPETGRLRDRLVIIDPINQPALGMFHQPAASFNADQKRAILNNLIETFSYIFSSSKSSLTARQRIPFAYVVRLVFSIGDDINTLMDVLEDKEKTSTFSDAIQKLSQQDDGARRFFQNDFYSTGFSETRQQVKTRLYDIISRPELMKMFGAPESRLSFFHCLQQGKIVVVNTSMALLGPMGSQLVGRWVIAQTFNAIFSRYFIPQEQWNPAYLIIDEFQDYVDPQKTPELLRLAREYKVGVLMAHQVMHAEEIDDKLRTAISTNTSIKYCASPEGIDINYMARDLRCEPEFLRQQTKTSTDAKFACFVRGLGIEHPFSIEVPFGNIQREPQMPAASYERLLEKNRQNLSAASSPKRTPPPPLMRPNPHHAGLDPGAGTDPEAGKDW